MAIVFYFYPDLFHDLRAAGLIVLSTVTIHAVLIFQASRFENDYLNFAWNFPYSRWKRFFDLIKLYLVLLMPESIWLFGYTSPVAAFELLLFGLGLALLFHSILYLPGLNMVNYIKCVFGIYFVLFFLIMLGIMQIMIVADAGIAFLIFFGAYNKRSSVVINSA